MKTDVSQDRLDRTVTRLNECVLPGSEVRGTTQFGPHLDSSKARDVLRELLQIDRSERELAHREAILKGLGPQARLVFEAIASGERTRGGICGVTALNERLVDRKLTALRMAGLIVAGTERGYSRWSLVNG